MGEECSYKEECGPIDYHTGYPKCHKKQYCHKTPYNVPHKSCHQVPQQQCKKVPHDACVKIPHQVAQKVSYKVPKQVCGYPDEGKKEGGLLGGLFGLLG